MGGQVDPTAIWKWSMSNECEWTPPEEYETSCYMGQSGSYWGGAYKTCNRAKCEAAGVCIVGSCSDDNYTTETDCEDADETWTEDAQLGTCLKTNNYRASVADATKGTCDEDAADPTTCVGLGGTWTATKGGWEVVPTNTDDRTGTSGDVGEPVQAWECGHTDRRGKWSSRGTRRGSRYRYAWDYMGSKKCDALGGNWVPATWKGMTARQKERREQQYMGWDDKDIDLKYQAATGCEYHKAIVMANNFRAAV